MTMPRVFSVVAVLAFALLATLPLSAQDQGGMDHAAMASSYQAEATEAKAKAAQHELMLNRYKNQMIFPKGSAMPKEQAVTHCQKLVDSYKEAAAQASDLAKVHQDLAKAAK